MSPPTTPPESDLVQRAPLAGTGNPPRRRSSTSACGAAWRKWSRSGGTARRCPSPSSSQPSWEPSPPTLASSWLETLDAGRARRCTGHPRGAGGVSLLRGDAPIAMEYDVSDGYPAGTPVVLACWLPMGSRVPARRGGLSPPPPVRNASRGGIETLSPHAVPRSVLLPVAPTNDRPGAAVPSPGGVSQGGLHAAAKDIRHGPVSEGTWVAVRADNLSVDRSARAWCSVRPPAVVARGARRSYVGCRPGRPSSPDAGASGWA